MKTLGRNYVAILSWHRHIKSHSILKRQYLKENLVSIGQTFVMLYFYLITIVLFLHFLATIGFMEHETLLWYMVETNVQRLYFALPESLYLDPFVALGLLLPTVLATLALRFAFNILKANLHPGAKKSFTAYLRRYQYAKFERNNAKLLRQEKVWSRFKALLMTASSWARGVAFFYAPKVKEGFSNLRLQTYNLKLNLRFRSMTELWSRLKRSLYLYSKAFQTRVRENKRLSNRSHIPPSHQSLPQSSFHDKPQISSLSLSHQSDGSEE